jgi:maltooligosyltrehalose trehalohydrolase
VAVRIVAPEERVVELAPAPCGYFRGGASGVGPGTRFFYRLDDRLERPDPASRFQPAGVHGPSEVAASQFEWGDQNWRGLPLEDFVLYEIHVGTFTREGTLDAIVPRLDALKDLGITAIELMPVAQFPGGRNWGYDGVYPFAVQDSYGGPAGLKRLVNACHQRGLAVVLDVVYNHLGPEGSYLADFAPYFTDRYHTPWGSAINFDGPGSDEVRRFFIENALQWVKEYHMDGLRLDAVHAIVDPSARPFLEELGAAVHQEAQRLHRHVQVIPESDRNDPRMVEEVAAGGYGLDAVWNDDFHHALHALLTEERTGYYSDFGKLEDLGKAWREGFVYSGQYSSYRQRRHGRSARHLPAGRFVVFGQNHDQVGNRMQGERLSHLVPFERLKLAAAVVLLSPYLPLLFMGEEYGEPAPFQFFVSHSDKGLIEAVRKGRGEEFSAFGWGGEVPDPQNEATFLRSKLDWELQKQAPHSALRSFYRELIRFRRDLPALAKLSNAELEASVHEKEQVLFIVRGREDDAVALAFHFGGEALTIRLPFPRGRWFARLDSSESRWGGVGEGAPADILAEDGCSVTLPPFACVVWSRSGAGAR